MYVRLYKLETPWLVPGSRWETGTFHNNLLTTHYIKQAVYHISVIQCGGDQGIEGIMIIASRNDCTWPQLKVNHDIQELLGVRYETGKLFAMGACIPPVEEAATNPQQFLKLLISASQPSLRHFWIELLVIQIPVLARYWEREKTWTTQIDK